MVNTIIDQTFVQTIKNFFGLLTEITLKIFGQFLKNLDNVRKKNTEGA